MSAPGAIYRNRAAELYDVIAHGVEGDLEFYLEAARKAGPPVLEAGCGTGRVVIPLARAGLEVHGLDCAADMLQVAAKKAAALAGHVRARITLVEGDMRAFDLGRRFAVILAPFRAFQHLLEVEDQKRALVCFRRHLAPGGRLILDLFDPSLDYIAAHRGALGGAAVRVLDGDLPAGGRLIVWETRRYDLESQLAHFERVVEEVDADGTTMARLHAPFTLRRTYRWEMEHLLALCGFQVESLLGDFRGGAFRHGGEQVWSARVAE